MTTDSDQSNNPSSVAEGVKVVNPDPENGVQGPPKPSMLTFYMIVACVVLPPVFGTLFFLNVDDWHPFGFANRGRLVTPPRVMLALKMDPVQERDAKLGSHPFIERWTLFTVAPQGCSEICRENLYKMRQSLIAQGLEDVDRVRYVLVTLKRPEDTQLQAIRKEHPMLSVMTPKTPEQAEKLVQLLNLEEDNQHAFFEQPRIYMVDPLGHWMMWYATDANARGILQDLERVLKISRIG